MSTDWFMWYLIFEIESYWRSFPHGNGCFTSACSNLVYSRKILLAFYFDNQKERIDVNWKTNSFLLFAISCVTKIEWRNIYPAAFLSDIKKRTSQSTEKNKHGSTRLEYQCSARSKNISFLSMKWNWKITFTVLTDMFMFMIVDKIFSFSRQSFISWEVDMPYVRSTR